MEKKIKLDDTRERLSIENLDKNDRKDLFNKFRQAGGQIIDDKDTEENSSERTEKDQKLVSRPINHSAREIGRNPFSTPMDVESISKSKSKKVKSNNQKPVVSGWSLFWVKLSVFFAGVTNFTATKFKQKFIHFTLMKIRQDVSVLKVLLDPIYRKETVEVLEFRKIMYDKNLLYAYEMAYHTCYVIEEVFLSQLQETMKDSVDASEYPFKEIYGRMLFLYPYIDDMRSSTHIVVREFKAHYPKIMSKNVTPTVVNQIFMNIWTFWFLSLEELINYYWNRHNSLNPFVSLSEFVDAPKKDPKIGVMMAKLQESMEKEKELQAEEALEEKSEPVVYPYEAVEKGVQWIKERISFQNYLNNFRQEKDLRLYLKGNDQIFYLYAIIDTWDKEFSLLWNSEIINYYVIPAKDTGRYDSKKELRILQTRMNSFYEDVNKYLRLVKAIETSANDAGDVLLQKQKDLSRASYTIRKNIHGIFMEFCNTLNKIIRSQETKEVIIGNWTDKLNIPRSHERAYISGCTVGEAIEKVYEVALASQWLLASSDLSGLTGKIIALKVLHVVEDDRIEKKEK